MPNLVDFEEYSSVKKSDITTMSNFRQFVKLCGLSIFKEEDSYVIITGPRELVEIFKQYWNS